MTPAENLPPVPLVLLSTIPSANIPAGINNTGGKFAACVNDTDGKLPLVFIYMVTLLPKGVQTK
jgi:hypothetical protein